MNNKKEALRKKVMYAYVEMENTLKTVFDTDIPHVTKAEREKIFKELESEWNSKYDESWFKPCWVAHKCDYAGWSDGYEICDTEEKAKKVTDLSNRKASFACRTAFYRRWNNMSDRP